MARMLESDEAARRLGIKVATLYAYVSRGQLTSYPGPSGRRRLFDMEEVERLARRSRQGKTVETRMVTITTGITQLTDDGPVYRGRAATGLATTQTYEDVAQQLWDMDGERGAGDDRTGRSEGREPLGEGWSPSPLGPPPEIGSWDRLTWAVLMSGALDPLRADLRPEAVTRAARRVAASMVDVLSLAGGGPAGAGAGAGDAQPLRLDNGTVVDNSMAARLAGRLSPAPSAELVREVNAAMVLLADHELATSTVAVRVAASTRADLYHSLLAGLATLSGPLHGGASQLAYSLLVEAERHGVARALDDTLRWQGVLPGFGHSVYKSGDARYAVLIGLFEQLGSTEQVELVDSLVRLAAEHTIPLPNVDLALAAVAWATGMPPDAGRTLFAVARVAGWTAHYLEELREKPLRYRPRAVYAASGRS
jgi:citrate synthase